MGNVWTSYEKHFSDIHFILNSYTKGVIFTHPIRNYSVYIHILFHFIYLRISLGVKNWICHFYLVILIVCYIQKKILLFVLQIYSCVQYLPCNILLFFLLSISYRVCTKTKSLSFFIPIFILYNVVVLLIHVITVSSITNEFESSYF